MTRSTKIQSGLLKETLGKLLVEFYRMEGRPGISSEGKLQVECEDQGLFVEAAADNCLAELGELSSPAPFMRQLVYDVPSAKNILELPPFIVQVTTFQCGGFVLGLHNHHCLMDGLSANEFRARGVAITQPPLDLHKTTVLVGNTTPY